MADMVNRNSLGLTTKTFMKLTDKGMITIEDVLRWAADKGFKWVEVRDDNAGMTKNGLKELLSLAGKLGIRLHYAWDGNKEQVKIAYKWAEVSDFYMEFKSRIPYMHIKSTKNNVLINRLILDGDIDYSTMFINTFSNSIFCIELPGIENLQQCKSNVEEAYKLITENYKSFQSMDR